ncbi:MAG: hypothetical protein ACE5I1_10445 [bacterium]
MNKLIFTLAVSLFGAMSTSLLPAQNTPPPIDSLGTLQQPTLQILPFRGEAQEYYRLFPGAVVQDYRGTDLLHVRGSRHDEIGYSFEGADVRSAFTGTSLLRFIPEALESINLQTAPGVGDGFAPSLLQHRLRRGSPRESHGQRGESDFRFSLRGESDRFTPDFKKRLGTYSYGYSDYVLTAGGKIFRDNLQFFIAGEREAFGDHYRKFWDGFVFSQPQARDNSSGKTLQELIGVDAIEVQPGNIPQASSRRYTLNGIATADFGPLDMQLVGLYDWHKRQENDTPIQHLFDPQRIPEAKQQAGLVSLQLDYRDAQFADAHLQFDYLKSSRKTYDPLFEDDFLLYRDSLAVEAKGVSWAIPEGAYTWGNIYFQGPGEFRYFAFPFNRPGDLLADYEKWQDDARGISGWVRKKIGAHTLTLGGSLQRRTLRRFAVRDLRGFMETLQEHENNPDRFSPIEQELRLGSEGQVQAFGYDVFGKEIEQGDDAGDAPFHPQTRSFYLADRIEADRLVLDFGLHYDVFATGGLVFKDPLDPQIYGRFSNILLSSMQEAPKHRVVSPRFSAIFSATDRLRLRFDFGKYAQMPQYNQVLASRGYLAWAINWAGRFNLEPRALDAEPVKSTQTAFSLSYRFQPGLNLDATLFHKTSDGYLKVDRNQAVVDYYSYLVLRNKDESIARGMELNLSYRNRGFTGWANYTFSALKGFQTYPLSNLGDYLYGFSEEENIEAGPYKSLESQQAHTGNVLLGYVFSDRLPFWLRNTGVSALLRFNSGHPYTLRDAGDALG